LKTLIFGILNKITKKLNLTILTAKNFKINFNTIQKMQENSVEIRQLIS